MFIRIIIILLVLSSCGGGGSSSTSQVVTNHDMVTLYKAEFETDEYSSASAATSASSTTYQNFLDQINASAAYAYLHNQGKSWAGDNVKVAVVDSGVLSTHNDLSSNYDATNSEATSGQDIDGHGTHVAGIIAATKNNTGMHGVAPNAKIVGVAMKGVESITYGTDDWASAVTSSGATVVNNSWGSSGASTTNTLRTKIKTVIDDNDKRVVVQASGNSNLSYTENPADQADHSNAKGQMLAVMALDKNGNKAYYSNGCTINGGGTLTHCIAAPGGSSLTGFIYSTSNNADNNSYVGYQGTSMAAPVVSGAAAILQGAWSNLTGAQVVDILLASATQKTEENVAFADMTTNITYKVLNLYAAVQKQGTSTTSTSNTNSFLYDNTNANIPNQLSALSQNKNLQSLLKKGVFFDKYNRDYKAKYNEKISFYGYRNNDFYNFFNISNNLETETTSFNSTSLNFTVTNSKNNIKIGEEILFTGQKQAENHSSIDNLSYKFNSKIASFTIGKNLPMQKMVANSRFASLGFITGNNFKSFYSQIANYDNFNFNSRFRLKKNLSFANHITHGKNTNTNKEFYGTSSYINHNLKKLDINYNFALYQEQDSLSGISGSEAFDLASHSDSKSFGVTFFTNFKSKWNYMLGVNWTKITPQYKNALITGSKDFDSVNYALGLIYEQDKYNKLGFNLSQPATINQGSLTFTLPTGIDSNSNIITDSTTINFADYKEYNAELFWQKQLRSENNLQLNIVHRIFDYTDNYNHQDDITELYFKYVKNF